MGTGKWLPYMSAQDAGAHKAGGNDYAADLYASPSNPQSDYNVATVAGSSAGKTPLLPQSSQTVGNSTSYFDYEELYTATNGFSPSTILGEGGFGRVYKGQLLSGKAVAVKQLTVGGGQGDREFRAEVEIISRVHHRHLVSLVGYCIVDSQRLLVYDFVPNGTLADNLHGKLANFWNPGAYNSYLLYLQEADQNSISFMVPKDQVCDGFIGSLFVFWFL